MFERKLLLEHWPFLAGCTRVRPLLFVIRLFAHIQVNTCAALSSAPWDSGVRMASSSAGPSMTSPRGSGAGTLPVTSSSNRFLSSMHLARKSGAEKNRLTDKNGVEWRIRAPR